MPLLSGVRGYRPSDIMVTLHNVMRSDGAQVRVPLQPATLNVGSKKSPDDANCIWCLLQDLSNEVLRDSLLKWEYTENLEYQLASTVCQSLPFPVSCIQELVQRMMDGRCFGQAGQDLITNRPDEVEVLQALCQKRLCEVRNIAPATVEAVHGYKLSQLGLDSLVF